MVNLSSQSEIENGVRAAMRLVLGKDDFEGSGTVIDNFPGKKLFIVTCKLTYWTVGWQEVWEAND